MRGNTHVMIALGSAAAVSTLTDLPFKEVPWFFVFFMSLLPDIDEPSSNASRPGTLFLSFAPKAIREVFDLIAKIILFPFRLFTAHRGITHAPLFFFLIGSAISFYSIKYSVWYFIAYGSHLFADYLTMMGIPLFWPFLTRNYSLKVCKTGSLFELFILFLFGGLFCFCCFLQIR